MVAACPAFLEPSPTALRSPISWRVALDRGKREQGRAEELRDCLGDAPAPGKDAPAPRENAPVSREDAPAPGEDAPAPGGLSAI